jgi:hypothetical protein
MDMFAHVLLGLLHKDPKCRLRKVNTASCSWCPAHVVLSQAADIKAHAFFKGVKWDKMLDLAVPPPFLPDIDGPSSLKYVRPKYLEQVRPLSQHAFFNQFSNAALQPAVETPVCDSPLAQRVRDEGASLFQGFSFERPSLLHRRRSRPQFEPVEDCFFGMSLSADIASDSVAGDAAAPSTEHTDDAVAMATASDVTFQSHEIHWFDVPPPDAVEQPRESSPSDFCDIEEELLGGGRMKQAAAAKGIRPKVSCDYLYIIYGA